MIGLLFLVVCGLLGFVEGARLVRMRMNTVEDVMKNSAAPLKDSPIVAAPEFPNSALPRVVYDADLKTNVAEFRNLNDSIVFDVDWPQPIRSVCFMVKKTDLGDSPMIPAQYFVIGNNSWSLQAVNGWGSPYSMSAVTMNTVVLGYLGAPMGKGTIENWNHVCYVDDGYNMSTLYNNGEVIGDPAPRVVNLAPPQTRNFVSLGYFNPAAHSVNVPIPLASRPNRGRYSHFTLYDHALTPQEALADYLSGFGCSNGRQNDDETGIDCGGSCLPCNSGGQCLEVTLDDRRYNNVGQVPPSRAQRFNASLVIRPDGLLLIEGTYSYLEYPLGGAILPAFNQQTSADIASCIAGKSIEQVTINSQNISANNNTLWNCVSGVLITEGPCGYRWTAPLIDLSSATPPGFRSWNQNNKTFYEISVFFNFWSEGLTGELVVTNQYRFKLQASGDLRQSVGGSITGVQMIVKNLGYFLQNINNNPGIIYVDLMLSNGAPFIITSAPGWYVECSQVNQKRTVCRTTCWGLPVFIEGTAVMYSADDVPSQMTFGLPLYFSNPIIEYDLNFRSENITVRTDSCGSLACPVMEGEGLIVSWVLAGAPPMSNISVTSATVTRDGQRFPVFEGRRFTSWGLHGFITTSPSDRRFQFGFILSAAVDLFMRGKYVFEIQYNVIPPYATTSRRKWQSLSVLNSSVTIDLDAAGSLPSFSSSSSCFISSVFFTIIGSFILFIIW